MQSLKWRALYLLNTGGFCLLTCLLVGEWSFTEWEPNPGL